MGFLPNFKLTSLFIYQNNKYLYNNIESVIKWLSNSINSMLVRQFYILFENLIDRASNYSTLNNDVIPDQHFI